MEPFGGKKRRLLRYHRNLRSAPATRHFVNFSKVDKIHQTVELVSNIRRVAQPIIRILRILRPNSLFLHIIFWQLLQKPFPETVIMDTNRMAGRFDLVEVGIF